MANVLFCTSMQAWQPLPDAVLDVLTHQAVCSSVCVAHQRGSLLSCRTLQFMIMGAQTGLVLWRKQHKRSYDLVRLATCSWFASWGSSSA